MDTATREQILAHLRFQRDLGVESLRVEAARALRATPGGPKRARAAAPESAARAGSAPGNSARGAAAGEDDSAGAGSAPFAAGSQPAESLAAIRSDLGDCVRCPLHAQGRQQIVFGAGAPRAELVFVGEAPGADEDAQGVPFIGRAGQLLTDMIQKGMGLDRSQVYICNVIKCRPPNNRTPLPEECAVCSPFLLRQIAAIRPKLIIALGAVAAQNLLHYRGSLASVRGRVHQAELGGWRGAIVVTYHPAFLLRDPSQKREAWKDLQLAMATLGVPIPARQS